MWLQLGNKSMLMNQKQGLRLADECQAPQQVTVAEEMKKNPPKSLFEAPMRRDAGSASRDAQARATQLLGAAARIPCCAAYARFPEKKDAASLR